MDKDTNFAERSHLGKDLTSAAELVTSGMYTGKTPAVLQTREITPDFASWSI
jgi:hypothetical protein